MHDDHMNGFPDLMRQYNTQVWCYENMVDIFENPRGHNLVVPWATFQSLAIVSPWRTIQMGRNTIRIYPLSRTPSIKLPCLLRIDGARIAFTGDALSPHTDPTQGVLRHNLIFRNHVESDSHLKSIRNLIDHEPNIIAPGHGRPFLVNHADLLATEQKLKQQEQLFREVIADPDVNFGLDPVGVASIPIRCRLTGDALRAAVRV